MKKALILTYHDIVGSDKDLYLYDVNFRIFRKQMECLCRRQRGLDNTNVMLTFDDGYGSWANEVLNALKKFGLKAYFFICIENLKKGIITKEDILRLKNNAMIIGSHSLTHRFLHRLPEADIFCELNESKKILEDIIQEKVEYFSIPRGVSTKMIIDTAKRAGYIHVFTSEIGINHGLSFSLKRVPLRRNTTLGDFENILNGKALRVMFCKQKLKDSAKRIFGIYNYNRLRKMLVPRAE